MWSIEFDPATQVLTLRLCHQVTAPQMRALARAHAEALVATGGTPFKVLADLRGLSPLDTDAATVFGELRRAAMALPGFRARAVLVDSPTVAMQQHRTAAEEGGAAGRELVTMDELEARSFLAGA
jgi:hypothetical protein